MKYEIESQRKLDLLQLLDAVGLILDPERHPPSTDTLMFKMNGKGPIREVRHGLMGLVISDVTES